MRNQLFALFIGALTALTLNNVAFAQNAGNENADETATTSPTSDEAENVSPSLGNTPQTYSTEEVKAAEGIATSTATTTGVVPPAPRLGVDLYIRADVGQTEFSKSEPSILNRNRVAFKYKLTDTRTVSLVPEFRYTTKVGPKAATAKMYDTYIGYQDSKVFMLPADIAIAGVVRYYAPTGASSQANGTNGWLYTWWWATKSIGKFDVSYHADFAQYLNSRNYHNVSKVNADTGVTTTEREGNINYWADQYFEVAYNFTPEFNVWYDLGSYHESYLGTTGVKYKRADQVYNAVGVSYSATKKISLNAAFANYATMDRKNNFKLYDKSENTAMGIVNFSL